MRHAAWLLGVVALASIASPRVLAAGWTRMETAHFVFVGDASERQIRHVAEHLEQFRDVLSRALPPSAVASSIPTIVFVFENDRSFTPYKPTFEGRPLDVAGAFQGGTDVNYILVDVELEQPALRVVFHEYAHFLALNTAGQLPPWANEGFAGVYETFEMGSDGTNATIGNPHPEYLALLENSTLMTLEDLLAVDHSSPEYNESNRRGVFYAESWALMHYLMFSSPDRAAQLGEYMASVKRGVEFDEAFRQSFGADTAVLDRELRAYIRQFAFPSRRLDFPEQVRRSSAGRVEAIDEFESGSYLADLLVRTGRAEAGRAHLQKLADANPRSSRALAALGVFEFTHGSLDAALPLLEESVARAPADGAAQKALGQALFRRSQEMAGDDSARDLIRRARSALNRAVDLAPRDAETLALLGRLEMMEGTDLERASALLERAMAIAPDEKRYRLQLADVLVRQEQFDRATLHLQELVGPGNSPEISQAANELLAYLSYVASRDARVEADSIASAEPAATPQARSPAPPPAAADGRFVPELRLLKPGELRVPGVFVGVECRTDSAVLAVEAAAESLRLATPHLSAVEFITYRAGPSAAVSCGAVRPPLRVLVTYRVDGPAVRGVNGRAVAIEVLPDGYSPP